ncbi:sigma-54-dependent Fis family transcriptional regulator [Brevibacillus parabrevis]
MDHTIRYLPDFQQILEAVSDVLKLEATLVNDEMVRIAGTGPYWHRIGESVHPDSAFGHALRSGLPVRVADPRVDEICQGCGARSSCNETAHIASPILGEKPIGVLGLIAFTDNQREQLMYGLDGYVGFLSKISELIGSKMKEEKTIGALLHTQGYLQAVTDSVTEGLVAADEQGSVTFLNGPARQLLRLSAGKLPSVITDLPGLDSYVREVLDSGKGLTNREFTVTTTQGSVTVLGNIQPIRVKGSVKGVVASLRDIQEVYELVNHINGEQPIYEFDRIIYRSSAMARTVERAKRVAGSQSTVLIRGESGTGKELFARAIHIGSPRREGPFIAINCAAIPEELLESELFGYVAGAFTGAHKGGKPGKFELANRGTIFLDEIGDMSLRLQAKLLRVIQESEVTRVGDTKSTRLEVRIIAATHQNLEKLIERKEFREDLYFRLNVIPIEIPPLRERPEDIPLLADYFRLKKAGLMDKRTVSFDPETEQALVQYHWPGNVRELENVVEYAITMSSDPLIGVSSLPNRVFDAVPSRRTPDKVSGLIPLKVIERREIQRGIKLYGTGEKAITRIALELGISRSTAYRRLNEYGLLPGVNSSSGTIVSD